QQLADLAPLELPTDAPRPAVAQYRGATLSAHLSAELTGRLKQLSAAHNATLFMTLLAAWQLLLGRLSGQQDVAVGSPIANRTRLETEPLIGFFVNTLVLRSRWQSTDSFLDLLTHVRQVTLEAYAHQDLPFERLVEELAPTRDLSRSPLFQTLFVFQNAPQRALHLGAAH